MLQHMELAQRRRRTFIFAYRNDTVYGKNMVGVSPVDVLSKVDLWYKHFLLLRIQILLVGH